MKDKIEINFKGEKFYMSLAEVQQQQLFYKYKEQMMDMTYGFNISKEETDKAHNYLLKKYPEYKTLFDDER